jgi:predicted metal-dependent hydrolase
MSEHPMDNIPIRKLRFNFDEVGGHNPVWSESSPDFSIFINALGVHVPHFERYLVRTMREYRDEINCEKLSADVKSIIGQESHHAFNFEHWTSEMNKRYEGLPEVDESGKSFFVKSSKESAKKFKIGLVAGYETFTFTGGLIVLDRYKELMEVADPTIRALWVWHQVEEVEHGAVAFDFYKYFYPNDEWYRRFMIVYAYIHIVRETAKAYSVMIKKEGFYKKPLRALKAWRFFISFGIDLAVSALPAFSKKYHPRYHPACNNNRNLVAASWQAYEAAGFNVEKLDDADVNEMLARSS